VADTAVVMSLGNLTVADPAIGQTEDDLRRAFLGR
jgi:hypothetical protein